MCMTGEEISAEWSCVGNCVGVGLQELIWVVAVEGLGRGGKSPGDATTEVFVPASCCTECSYLVRRSYGR